ncbi:MAG: cell division protein SepF [Acidimicrobiales bacterium]
MSSTWRKAMVYLGLGPDDEYDDYAASPDERPMAPNVQTARPQQPQQRPTGTVRARPPASGGPVLSTPPETGDVSAVRPIVTPVHASGGGDASKPRVRAVPRRQSVRPHLVTPTSFNEAQEIADNFKSGSAVAMDLYDADRDLSRRLIDFSSGLCYGLGGTMEKIASTVYLILPMGAEVPAEERARLISAVNNNL